MDKFFKYLNLYIVNEITSSTNLIQFQKNKRYVLAIFKNNDLIELFINYKFIRFNYRCKNCYTFIYNIFTYTFGMNNDINETIIFELAYDFNYNHLMDILLTHYNNINVENINNINNINICLLRHRIYKHVHPNTPQASLLKISYLLK